MGASSDSYGFSSYYREGAYLNFNIGIGVELFSPLEKGFSMEIFMEQEFDIDEFENFRLSPGMYVSVFYNY